MQVETWVTMLGAQATWLRTREEDKLLSLFLVTWVSSLPQGGLLSTLLIPPFPPAAPALSPLRTQPVSVYHRDYSSPGSPIFFIYSWGFEDIIFLAL